MALTNKHKNSLARVQQMQAVMDSVAEDLAGIQKFRKKLVSVNKRMKQLSAYYGNDWIKDYELQSEMKELANHEILGQDPLFELITDHYNEMKKLLLVCAKEINQL